MSISDLHPHSGATPGPAAVLAEIVSSLQELDGTWWTNQSDEELVATVGLVAQLRAVAAAVEAGAVAEADHRDLAKQDLHYGSTGDWVTHFGGLRKGEGKRVVRRAHALTGPLAATRAALASGRVSPEQADVVVKAVQALPSGDAVRARGEATLLDHAGSLDASDLARTGRHLVHVVDPDAQDRRLERQLAREERAAHLVRYLSIAPDGAGGVRVKGYGTAEDAAVLKAALLPLTVPTPAADDHDGQDGQGGELVRDPRDAGARMWDALITVAHHALHTHLPPESHGTPARLMVTINLHALQDRFADAAVGGVAGIGITGVTGVTGDGLELSATTVRRLACDAEIVPVVLGGRGEPLDVGRIRYPVTPAMWTALRIRDRHCAFPGCDRPPVMCHAHHIRHWAHGGTTKLSNLVLLCGHHHRVIHTTPWEVRINPHDHKPEFLPPPKPGVERKWIRHRPRHE